MNFEMSNFVCFLNIVKNNPFSKISLSPKFRTSKCLRSPITSSTIKFNKVQRISKGQFFPMIKPLDPLRNPFKTAFLSSSKLTPFFKLLGIVFWSSVKFEDDWERSLGWGLPAIMEVDLSFLAVLGLTLPSRLGSTKNVPSEEGTEVLWDRVLEALEELRLKLGRRFFLIPEQSLGILKTHLK